MQKGIHKNTLSTSRGTSSQICTKCCAVLLEARWKAFCRCVCTAHHWILKRHPRQSRARQFCKMASCQGTMTQACLASQGHPPKSLSTWLHTDIETWACLGITWVSSCLMVKVWCRWFVLFSICLEGLEQIPPGLDWKATAWSQLDKKVIQASYRWRLNLSRKLSKELEESWVPWGKKKPQQSPNEKPPNPDNLSKRSLI